MVQDLVVEGKVVAGDEVDASILLDLPVLETQSLTLAEKLIARDLAAPVRFSGLLELSEATHTREAENGAEPARSANMFTTESPRGAGQHDLRLNHFQVRCVSSRGYLLCDDSQLGVKRASWRRREVEEVRLKRLRRLRGVEEEEKKKGGGGGGWRMQDGGASDRLALCGGAEKRARNSDSEGFFAFFFVVTP